MCRSASFWRGLLALALAVAGGVALAQTASFPGVGRSATPREVKAWDIDVRPDFRGLPKGEGSVAAGQVVWEAQCASCHGIFAEGGEGFAALVGGTTLEDIRSGRVVSNRDGKPMQRTTLMKLATLSTLWDYIHRAMPWKEPKSLGVDQVYAVTAFVLHLGGVVGSDFVLSDKNIAQVQQRMPNRKGMTFGHALWPGPGLGGTARADVGAVACMKDCAGEVRITSALPEHARGSHGNLAEQNRAVGAQRGVDAGAGDAGRGRD
jgi:cytochrome c